MDKDYFDLLQELESLDGLVDIYEQSQEEYCKQDMHDWVLSELTPEKYVFQCAHCGKVSQVTRQYINNLFRKDN